MGKKHGEKWGDHAKALRQRMSSPEVVLWAHLRGRRLAGWKFRRQHPIGVYVADFFCHEAKLVVEVDGLVHGSRMEQDRARDQYMKKQGLIILRIQAKEVLVDLQSVLRRIWHTLEASRLPKE